MGVRNSGNGTIPYLLPYSDLDNHLPIKPIHGDRMKPMKPHVIFGVTCLLLFTSHAVPQTPKTAAESSPRYRNASLSIDDRVADHGGGGESLRDPGTQI